jgi:hypothetical protein
MNTQHTEGPWLALIAAAPELLALSLASMRGPVIANFSARCLAMVEEGDGPPNWDWIREVIAKATTP